MTTRIDDLDQTSRAMVAGLGGDGSRLARGPKSLPSPNAPSSQRPTTNPERNSLSGWFWGGFFAILLFGATLAIFAAIRATQTLPGDGPNEIPVPPEVITVIRVIVSPGESVSVTAATLAKARFQVLERLDIRRAGAEQALTATMDQELERIFAEADKQVPVFADWYYSLKGEYLRLLNAAFGDLPAVLAEKLDELVFGPPSTAQAIDTLDANLGAESVILVAGALGEARDLLVTFVRENGLETDRVRVTGELDLSGQFSSKLKPYVILTPEDLAPRGVAASAGAAAGAAAAKKLGGSTVAKAAGKLAAKPATGAAGALAAKLSLKSAAKAGSALGSAGTGAAAGAAICAGTVAGVPLSLGCALIGGAVSGVAAWLLVDKAVIEADEYLNRAELEAGLREALGEQKTALRGEFETRYIASAGAVLDQVRSDLETELAPRPIELKPDLVPAEAASPGGQ